MGFKSRGKGRWRQITAAIDMNSQQNFTMYVVNRTTQMFVLNHN